MSETNRVDYPHHERCIAPQVEGEHSVEGYCPCDLYGVGQVGYWQRRPALHSPDEHDYRSDEHGAPDERR